MARPIQPTPTLYGEDALALLESIRPERTASAVEMRERADRAQKFVAWISTPPAQRGPRP